MKYPCQARLACGVLSRLAELCGLRASACAAAAVSAASMARPMRMAAAGAWSVWAEGWNDSPSTMETAADGRLRMEKRLSLLKRCLTRGLTILPFYFLIGSAGGFNGAA